MKKKISIVFISFFLILMNLGTLTGSASADTYANYNALKAHNTINVDYKIESRDTASSTAVIAIHGGNIEMETTQIASAVAIMGGYDFYSFESLKSNSSSLHITATNFDEPLGRSLVAKSNKTLSVHGCVGTSQINYLGGLDTALGQKIKAALQAAGFKVLPAPASLGGSASANICNCNRTRKGVQLELTTSLRNQLASNSKTFNLYVTALAKALNN